MAGNRPVSDQDVATAVARWTEIRNAIDPGHTTWWIAEGERPEYLEVFDGLFVYKIDHACCPNSYQKAPHWANSVRRWEQQTGQPKLWVGTVMPGWDDLNSAQAHCVDLRVSSEQFTRDRGNGAYYARTWKAVLATAPDMILVHSFNEWSVPPPDRPVGRPVPGQPLGGLTNLSGSPALRFLTKASFHSIISP